MDSISIPLHFWLKFVARTGELHAVGALASARTP